MNTKCAFLFCLFVAALITPSVCFACSPAEYFTWESIESDAPDCVTMEGQGGYSEASLLVTNACDDDLVLEAVDCEDCAQQTFDVPSTSGDLEPTTVTVVASEPPTKETRLTQELRWVLGSQTGSVRTIVHYRDNSDACDGCSVAGLDEPRMSWWLICVALGFLGFGFRRSVSGSSTGA